MSSISDDDDSGPSLKELVTKNLEANGLLGKLQAQLRASVFLILEEEFQEKNIPILNEMTNKRLNCDVGKIAISIIQDFLQSLKLEFTLAVFVPETKSLSTESAVNRQYLSKKLGRSWKENEPVLFQLIEESRESDNQRTNSDPLVSNADNRVILSTNTSCNEKSANTSCNEKSTSEHDSECTKSEEGVNQEASALRATSLTNDTTQPKITNIPETKEVSENKISKSELQESSESTNITNNKSIHSTSSNKTSSSNPSSSSSHNVSKNDTLNPSLTNNQKVTEKEALSGVEKEYEEEFSSLSENQQQSTENSSTHKSEAKNAEEKKKNNQSEEKTIEGESDIEEEVETAEDIEEDISSLDDLLSSNSEVSNQTKDITASKESTAPDYEETL